MREAAPREASMWHHDLTIRHLKGLPPVGKVGGTSRLRRVTDSLLELLALGAIICGIAGIVWLLWFRV